MIRTIARTRRIGGSLVVTVPIEIVKEESIQEGEFIEITIEKPKKSAFGIFSGMGSFEEDDKFKGQLEDE